MRVISILILASLIACTIIGTATAEPKVERVEVVTFPEPLPMPTSEPVIEITEEPYTQAEKELIARVVYAEARGESTEGKIAVACVVLNRQQASGKSIKSIVFAPHQFAVSSKYNDECMQAVETAIENNPYPETMLYFQVANLRRWTNRPSIVRYCRIGNHTFYVGG